MDTFNSNNQSTTPNTNTTGKRRTSAAAVSAVVGILMLATGIVGGFYFGTQQKTTSTSSQTTQPTTDQPAKPNFYVLTSESHPFDLKKTDVNKSILVSLAAPADFQVVKVSSANQNRGYEQYFTNKYNDEMGRWVVGYPSSQDNGNSEISLLAIGQEWLKATQDIEGKQLTVVGADLNTPAQKAKFLNDLKTNTEACAKDQAKGFATKDGVLKICYETVKRDTDGILVLKGYGEIQGQQMVLVGTVTLPGTTPNDVQKWIDSLSQSTLTTKG